MKQYFKNDSWLITEEGFEPSYNRVAESIMSLGNGHMGIRGNFEEEYSGDTLQGTYYAGVYYPDKTKVGWWKNGYPEFFAKVLNGINFIGIDVKVDGRAFDLAKCEVKSFKRVLDMQHGYLERSFIATNEDGNEIEVYSKRFLNMADSSTAAIHYSVIPLNKDMVIEFTPYLDGYVKNEDSNYDEIFWNEVNKKSEEGKGSLTTQTKKLGFQVTCAYQYDVLLNDERIEREVTLIEKDYYVGNQTSIHVAKSNKVSLVKYVAVVTNRDYNDEDLMKIADDKVTQAYVKGYDKLFDEHRHIWDNRWNENDITIEGDISAQQGIRFNIFQLNQTYTGEDSRLNIGPKGFTGEKYGGSTYWDTEAYCLPFYLSTASSEISKNLLIYRYNHLEKAKENAAKLGVKGALYPMVTMNGEECHNEWEITFEEIHRNGAIAYAIYNYVNYTNDTAYLHEYGYEVLVEISRYWADRVNYNPIKDKYMIIGVTGPNEYDNNVNNNWYTNTIAAWTLEYTLEVRNNLLSDHKDLCDHIGVDAAEIEKWKEIIEKMYYPVIEELGVFEQQDGYLDKEQKLVEDLDLSDFPINQNWSWDRILRSCFIKQADVLQGLYFFNDRYDRETIKNNFDFYEPKTVHESSLSSCIHSIIASQIGYKDKAYEFYLRTARLDLDNYNNDTEDGLHITSMTGSWLSIVHGFGGLKVKNGMISLTPYLPEAWKKYTFRLVFRDRIIEVEVDSEINIDLKEGEELDILIYNKTYRLSQGHSVCINHQ